MEEMFFNKKSALEEVAKVSFPYGNKTPSIESMRETLQEPVARLVGAQLLSGSLLRDPGPFKVPCCPKGPFWGLFLSKRSLFCKKKKNKGQKWGSKALKSPSPSLLLSA